MNTPYDLCIIGAGPAGYAAAIRAWDFGKRICLVEKADIGGAGVHNGVLLSKTLWELSLDYLNALRFDRGYRAESVELTYSSVMHAVQTGVQQKTEQMHQQLTQLSREQGSIDFIQGEAQFLSAEKIKVHPFSGQSLIIEAQNFIIATGGRPRILDSIQVDTKRIITSDHIAAIEEFPRSLVILGAGVVGCEFATIFANFGKTKVYLIDRKSRILPFEDEDVSRLIAQNLEAKGVSFHHQSKLVSMQVKGDEVEYVIEHASGAHETIEVEKALISVGRVPNTERLGLDKAGVDVNERGYIIHTDTQTSADNIYAVGDVTYDIALVNVGEIEARHAVEKMYGNTKEPLSYTNLSTIIFADPEMAAIGMNEQEAQKKAIPYRVAVYGFPLVNRAIAMRETEGFVKLLVSDDGQMRIIGMRALGAHASSTIEAVSLIIRQGGSVKELAELIHPHPAITEAVQECARMLMGTSIYKPEIFPEYLRLSRVLP